MDPWAKSNPQPMFVNKLLQKHSKTYSFTYHLWPLQWQSWVDVKRLRPISLKYLPSGTCRAGVLNPRFRWWGRKNSYAIILYKKLKLQQQQISENDGTVLHFCDLFSIWLLLSICCNILFLMTKTYN